MSIRQTLRIAGPFLFPGDPGYDRHRKPLNPALDPWPAVVVQAAGTADVREATRDPTIRVWATDRTADWLLWRIPDLRGRLAYDHRFELYDQATLDRIVGSGARKGDWRSSLNGYRVVIVDDLPDRESPADEPGANVAFRDHGIAVVKRR